jgi:integrase/recombinase XerC
MDLARAVATYVEGRAARGESHGSTVKNERMRLAKLVAVCPPGLPVGGLDRGLIGRWQESVGQYRPATRRIYLSTVRSFCRWLLAEGLLAADPTAAVARVKEPRRVPRALSTSAVNRLTLVLPDRRAELIVGLMFHVGLRCVEVARLTVDDYDPVASTVVVVGKNSDERTLPVRAEVARALDGWFRDRRAVGVSAARISRLVSGWMAAAGLKRHPYDGISAHALRHSFASNMLERCHDVRAVQTALGHVNLATTDRYLRPTDLEVLRAAMCG